MSRDLIGTRTLYYAVAGDRMLVSGSLFELAGELGALTPDPVSVCEHLTYRYVSGGRTLFREVSKVPAGYTVSAVPRGGSWDVSAARSERFDWGAQRHESHAGLSALLEAELGSVLGRSSPVRPGMFFSGGLDSCILAALSPEPPLCFNVTPSAGDLDESHYASTAAAHLGLDLEVVRFDHEGFMKAVRRAVELSEGTLPVEQLAMYQHLMAAAGVPPVMLTGYGADFLMGESQRKYWAVLRSSRVLGMGVVSAGMGLYGLMGVKQRQQAGAIREFLARFGEGQMWVDMLPALDPPCDPETARLAMGLDGLPDYHSHRRRLLSDEMPPHFTQRIFVTYGNLIADTVSSWSRLCTAMGCSLSIPFLDRGVVDLVTSLAPDSYLSMVRAKPPVRGIAARLLSRDLLDRPKLHGLFPPGFLLGDATGALGEALESLGGRGIADPSVLLAHAARRERYSYIPVWAAFTMETLFRCLEGHGVRIG